MQTPFSINYCTHNIWLRFGLTKFIMYSRDTNCRMTSKERKGRAFTVTVKSVSAKHLQLARASKGKIVEIPLDISHSAMIRHDRTRS